MKDSGYEEFEATKGLSYALHSSISGAALEGKSVTTGELWTALDAVGYNRPASILAYLTFDSKTWLLV